MHKEDSKINLRQEIDPKLSEFFRTKYRIMKKDFHKRSLLLRKKQKNA